MSRTTMRALTFDEHGGPDVLRFRDDLAVPSLDDPRDVRVRVVAAALNHLDLFVLGGLPNVRNTPPWIPGADAAGIVDAVGAAVTHVAVGDRVIINPGMVPHDSDCEYCAEGEQPLCLDYGILGEHRPGTLAEYVVVPGMNVASFGTHATWAEAAAFPLATLTAWRMVVSKAQVAAGEDVLIQGIGGGVALAALQIAVRCGATVWVTSSSDDKLDRARALGAAHTLNYRTEDVGRTIRTRTGKRGVDVVIDSVGEATWAASLHALGKRGRLVTCGGTSGPHVSLDVRRMFWNQWTLMGSTMGNPAEFAAIAAELADGHLRPPVDSVFALADGRSAFERLAAGAQFGKVVVQVADDEVVST